MISIGRALFGLPCLAVFLIYKFERRKHTLDVTTEEFLHSYKALMPTRSSYYAIRKMAKGFKQKLGQGGYGSVFKGEMPTDNRLVAITIMNSRKSNGQDFINEVATIERIHHVNVVQLIGFVAERSKRALIYEFMPNGSLEKFIFPQEGRTVHVSWGQTFEIVLEVAYGIEYLHRGCEVRILHFGIKPHNLLLDKTITSIISDFGLGKLCPTNDNSVTFTVARGTIGYIVGKQYK